MTAIRNLVFVLLCSLTTSSLFAGVASANQSSATDWISELTNGWQCEANGEPVSLVGTDKFHAELLSTGLHAENALASPAQDRASNKFLLVAENVWQSLWSTDDMILEVMSETAIKLILAANGANNTESQSVTCTINPEVEA